MNSLTFEIARFLDGDRPNAPAHIRLLAGASVGGVLAVFSPVLGGLWWLKGSEIVTRGGVGVRLDWLTFLYPIGAIIGGALLFLLAPVTRNRLGAAVLGALAFLPWFAAMAWCVDRGYADWQALHTFLTVGGAAVFGGPCGWFATRLTSTEEGDASTHPAI